ncbi:hypothetical protein RM555_16355 [Micromonospora sp. DSM 115977]|uniref:Chitin-binding type-3 domain-containing protein n=1 Tax=Micromonospora reichwaldensis TaxID=3075516 RepID=A0ABU2WXA5_9ACTN|nr:carbohydrate-binding protein [Micromonospora sp. DSM 115977]MDT0530566.1 hypothetical protein [Micromonospora sp. DSM 115977]
MSGAGGRREVAGGEPGRCGGGVAGDCHRAASEAGQQRGAKLRQQADWLYFADRQVLTPAQVAARVAGHRSAGTTHTDTVGAGGACPTPPPSSPPPSSPPSSPPPSTPPPSTPPPANCAGAPNWDRNTVYLGGQRVRHNGRLWQANWWTLGSEPGLTAQWRDLGPC